MLFEINFATDIYDKIITYLSKNYKGNTFYIDDSTYNLGKKNYDENGENEEEEYNWMDYEKTRDDIKFLFPYVKDYEMVIDDKKFKITHEKVGKPLSGNAGSFFHIQLFIDCEEEDMKDLIFNSFKFDKNLNKKKLKIYIRNPKADYWTILGLLPKRNLNTVFLPFLDEIINDITVFVNSELEYNNCAIPYKRNYLFYGPPGTGKTSIITAIASELNMGVAVMNFGKDLDDGRFIHLISRLQDKCILVLEDIDSLFIKRRRGEDNNTLISFSTILNTLDGLARKHRLITFMTTNYKENLDSALLRPGRIDKIFEFKFICRIEAEKMFKFYIKNDCYLEDFLNYINGKNISTAVLQKFLFENREEEDIRGKFSQIDILVDQYKDFRANPIGSMYS